MNLLSQIKIALRVAKEIEIAYYYDFVSLLFDRKTDTANDILKYCMISCTGLYAQLKGYYCSVKITKQRESIPMSYPDVEAANRGDDLSTVVEEEAALDQLGLRKLLFIDRVGTSRLPSHMNILVVLFTCYH